MVCAVLLKMSFVKAAAIQKNPNMKKADPPKTAPIGLLKIRVKNRTPNKIKNAPSMITPVVLFLKR